MFLVRLYRVSTSAWAFEEPWSELCGSLQEGIGEKAPQHTEESVRQAMKRLRGSGAKQSRCDLSRR